MLCAAGLAACSQSDPSVTSTSAYPQGSPVARQSATPPPAVTSVLDRSPTPDLVATVQAGLPAETLTSQVSPDGLWWARVFSHPCPEQANGEAYGYDYLQIGDQRSGEQSILFSQLIACGGTGAGGLEGRFWAPTSRYYYFTDAARGAPGGCGYWRPPLLRLDVTDWSITLLGAGTFSPDGFQFAAWLEDELVIWDLSTGLIASAAPPVAGALPGPITWSPDEQAIAYLLSESDCPRGLTYLVRMELSDLHATPYLASQDPSFVEIQWLTPNRVTLTDEDGQNWAYNFITGELAHDTP